MAVRHASYGSVAWLLWQCCMPHMAVRHASYGSVAWLVWQRVMLRKAVWHASYSSVACMPESTEAYSIRPVFSRVKGRGPLVME